MGNVESSAIPEKFTVLTQDQKAYYDEKFNALLKAGKSEVEAIAELLQSEAKNKYPKAKIDKEKASFAEGGHCSFMARTITEEMFEKYKDISSGGLGNWTISRAINTGVMFPRAYMGIHAGDPESYDTFIDLYKPCVE
eukprot:gene640-704_t